MLFVYSDVGSKQASSRDSRCKYVQMVGQVVNEQELQVINGEKTAMNEENKFRWNKEAMNHSSIPVQLAS